MKSTIRATILALGIGTFCAGMSGVAAPALAFETYTVSNLPTVRDVGREAFQPLVGGVPIAMRPATLAREQMPTGLTGWAHDGTDMVSNGQAAYPVLTRTAQDHPPTGLDHGMLLTERFPDAAADAPSYAGIAFPDAGG